jgi:hypothetical protein
LGHCGHFAMRSNVAPSGHLHSVGNGR